MLHMSLVHNSNRIEHVLELRKQRRMASPVISYCGMGWESETRSQESELALRGAGRHNENKILATMCITV